MSIPVSTVDTVKDFLVAGIAAQVNDTSVLVSYDLPGEDLPDDIIVVGDIDVDTQVHAFVGSGGQHWLAESYRVQVSISVYRGGDNASLTWKRAKTLSDAIDTLIRTDPSLGGVVQLAWPSRTSFKSEWEEEHRGRIVTVDKEISVSVEI